MKSHALWISLITYLLAISSSQGREIDIEKPSGQLRRFVLDTIFVVEVGDRERFSKRLPESINVQFHGEAGPIALAERHLSELCSLTGVKQVDSVSDEAVAKIDIYFGPHNDLSKVANEINRKISLDSGQSSWTWWNEKRFINRAVIFVATDKFSGPSLEDAILDQSIRAFGLPSRSKEFDGSCLSTKEQVLTALQPLDKAVLGFYYRSIPAGSPPREVDKIFREQWAPKAK